MKTTTDDIYQGLVADLICRYAGDIGVRLCAPTQLTVKMRAGNSWTQERMFAGGEKLLLSGVTWCPDTRDFKMTLVPSIRAEWSHTDLSVRKCADLVEFELTVVESDSLDRNLKTFSELQAALLRRPSDVQGKSWGHVIEAGTRGERARLAKEQLGSHEEFGTW